MDYEFTNVWTTHSQRGGKSEFLFLFALSDKVKESEPRVKKQQKIFEFIPGFRDNAYVGCCANTGGAAAE
jgi:hypothetical protein